MSYNSQNKTISKTSKRSLRRQRARQSWRRSWAANFVDPDYFTLRTLRGGQRLKRVRARGFTRAQRREFWREEWREREAGDY